MPRNPGVHIRFEPETLQQIGRINEHLRELTGDPGTLADAVRFAVRQTLATLPKKKRGKVDPGVDTVDPRA